MARLSDTVRLRLREEMKRRKLSHRDAAALLNWTQSKVAHNLTGYVDLTVDSLEALCFVLGLHVTEAVRDHGLEWCAEMTPTELRLLERIRELSPAARDAVLILLDVPPKNRSSSRRAAAVIQKPRNAR